MAKDKIAPKNTKPVTPAQPKQTIVATPTPVKGAATEEKKNASDGCIVGFIVIVAMLVACLAYCCYKKRQYGGDEHEGGSDVFTRVYDDYTII